MKILQINSVCGFGSTGRIATDLYEILKEQGHECKIAYGRDEARNIPIEDTIKIGSDADVKFHVLMTRLTDRTGFYSKKATEKFIKEIEIYNPDVIHLHNIHGYYINIEMLFKYLAKENKPIIWTLHDCWSFTGHCAYFDYAKCEKWLTECNSCIQKKSYPTSNILDNSRKNFICKKKLFTAVKNMQIITPSKWLADLVKQSYLSKYEVKVINNGIDLGKFKPMQSDFKQKNQIEDKKLILGVASIWDERKGLKDFYKLSEMLDDSYKIILVGLSQKQLDEIPKNILGIARTNSIEELVEIYSIADVFVNPTYEDNFPTTNLEALACGTPVITYNTGGSPESIDGNCGVMVDKGDINDLKKAIEHSIKDNIFSVYDCTKRSELFDKGERYLEYIKKCEELS